MENNRITTAWRLTNEEVGLLKEISRWRRSHRVRYFQWRPGVSFGVFTEWKRYDDQGRQINVSYEPDRTDSDEPRPHVAVTKDYRWGEFERLPTRTVTETVDVLVALGYLPTRFSSAYGKGWHAGGTWHDSDPDETEFARLFHDPENISFPAGEHQ